MTVAQEDRVLENDLPSWWLARVVSRTTTRDFRSASFILPPGTPVACPALPGSADAKVQESRYTWHGTSAAKGTRRRIESEAVYDGPTPPGAPQTPSCFPPGDAAETRTCPTYDTYGNLATNQVQARAVLDATGSRKTLTTSLTASADGYFPRTETNAAGHVSTVETDPKTGQALWQQGIQGGPVTTTEYDGLGRVLTVTSDGTQPVHERQLACPLPELTPALPPCEGDEVMARAAFQAAAPTRVEYLDRLGRVVRTASESFDGTFVVQADVAFNARGVKVSEYAPYRLGATKYETRYTGLDALGRVGVREVDRNPGLFATGAGEEATLRTEYTHERLETSIEAYKPGAQTALEMSRTYDARGKLVETAQRVAGTGSNEAVTQYRYDAAGALTNIRSGSRRADGSWERNPDAIDLVATYDNLGRKTSVKDPDRGLWTYTWDGLGRLRTQTDARGSVTAQDYDDIGRPLERRSTKYGETPIIANWTWDQPTLGALGRLDGSDGYARTYEYDALRRPVKVTTTVPEQDAVATSDRTFAIEYGYDTRTGSLKAKRFPHVTTQGGEMVVFDHSELGFPIGETQLLANYTRGTRYRRVAGMDERGQVTAQDLGNGFVETSTYDPSTGLVLSIQATKASSVLRATQYRYDHFLNLAWQEKTLPPAAPTKVTETFTYDDLQRIRTASRAWVGLTGETPSQDSYAYDDLGNLTSKSDYGTPYTYGTSARTSGNAGPHAVRTVTKAGGGTATFTYDNNGNLISGDGRRIDFDLMDRPVRVCSGTSAECEPSAPLPGATSEFAYAPDGARYRQVVFGAVEPSFGPKTVYYVDKDYELTVWPANGPARPAPVLEERSYLGGSVVIFRRGETLREVRYLHKDRLGSLDAVTDAGGNELMVDAHGFDPWGKPRKREWTSSGERLHPFDGGVTTKRGFTGHEHLDAHYLIHMNGRVYDYRLGRFLSVDPIISDPANPQTVNPYSYIGNNPLSGTDPTGYMECATTGSHVCGSTPVGQLLINGNPVTGSMIALYHAFKASFSGATGQGTRTATANPADQGAPRETAKTQTENTNPYGFWDRLFWAGAVDNPAWKAEWKAQMRDGDAPYWGDKVRMGDQEWLLGSNRALDKSFINEVQTARVMNPVVVLAVTMRAGGPAPGKAVRGSASTADDLTVAAARARAAAGPGKGHAHGSRAHSAFRAEVEALGRGNLATEVSYLNGRVVPYGTPGSVRVDVVEGPLTAPKAVFDFKTGSATLSPARINEIRRHLPGGGRDVPILEIR